MSQEYVKSSDTAWVEKKSVQQQNQRQWGASLGQTGYAIFHFFLVM